MKRVAGFQSESLCVRCLRFPFLLSRIESLPASLGLDQEKALISGKMGDHSKALKILVHNLKDYKAAEDYCDKISQQNNRALLTTLLAVYLDSSLRCSSIARQEEVGAHWNRDIKLNPS